MSDRTLLTLARGLEERILIKEDPTIEVPIPTAEFERRELALVFRLRMTLESRINSK